MSRTEIAGVAIPDSPLCAATTEYARRMCAPFLFNHVMRTYVFGVIAGRRSSARYDDELLYTGCLLHDLGLCPDVPVAERFEVDGADAARRFLTEQGMDEVRVDIVWDAIALHTTAGVPPRKRPEIALVQLGAAIDVGVAPLALVAPPLVDEILESWPRAGFKRAIVDAMVNQLARDPRSAASPVVSDVGARHVHGFRAANICDAIENAAFAE